MAVTRPYRYGSTIVDTADIDQFVMGVMAKDDEVVRRVGKALATGALTAIALTAYGRYKRGR